MRVWLLRIVASVLFLSSSVVMAQMPAAYQMCVACHGENGEGNSALNAPALAGQLLDYVVRQLNNFKSGLRGTAEGDAAGAQMAAFASALTETDINDIAEYLSTLPLERSEPNSEADLLAGRKVYNGNCSDCHGPQAEGNVALSSPMLAGLSQIYLVEQFKKFQKSQRGYEKADKRGRQMQFMSDVISDETTLKNVAAYILTLSGQE